MSTNKNRGGKGFVAGTLIGALGGLVGVGGGEFRLPVLVGLFGVPTLKAIIFNRCVSLFVIITALVFRAGAIPPNQLAQHLDVPFNLLAGSLIGAWLAAGHALTMPRQWLNRIIMVLLVGLALLMLSEACFGMYFGAAPLFQNDVVRFIAGVICGFGIGAVVALLGVAGGELFIPIIVLLYGLNIKLAGSLSLMVSLPTMLVDLARYSRSDAFGVLGEERLLFRCMVAGSIVGAVLGGMLLGLVPTNALLWLLGIMLLVSAFKTFQACH